VIDYTVCDYSQNSSQKSKVPLATTTAIELQQQIAITNHNNK